MLLVDAENNESMTLISAGDSIIYWRVLAYEAKASRSNKETRAIEDGEGRREHHAAQLQQPSSTTRKTKRRAIPPDANDDVDKRPRTPPVPTVDVAHMSQSLLALSSSDDDDADDDTDNSQDASSTDASAAAISVKQAPQAKQQQQWKQRQPTVVKHLKVRFKPSIQLAAAEQITSSIQLQQQQQQQRVNTLELHSVIGYNGLHASANVVWSASDSSLQSPPPPSLFAFSIGSVVCVEDLRTGRQRLLASASSPRQDITVLALRNDVVHLAAASSSSSFAGTSSLRDDEEDALDTSIAAEAEINIWDVRSGTWQCVTKLRHASASNLTCMSYSSDDRYLAAVADYARPSLCVWRATDYSHVAHVDLFEKGYIVNDMAWSRGGRGGGARGDSGGQLAVCGQRNLLMMCRLNEIKAATAAANTIRLDRINIEAILNKQQGVLMVDFTVVRFGGGHRSGGEEELLFAATSLGLVSVWHAASQACLLHWQADSCEIDALSLVHMPSLSLFTGSTSGTLRLWNLPKDLGESHTRRTDQIAYDSSILEFLILV